MKKIYLALVALVAMALTACEGPEGPPGPGMNWFIQNFTVKANEWNLDSSGTYYICEKSFSRLDNYVYTDGNVSGYIILNPGQKDEVLQPLEATYHQGNAAGDRWTETYSFDYMPGSIAFYVQYSDFAIEQPPTQQFRIVLNW